MNNSNNAQVGQTTQWVLVALIVVILFAAIWLVRDIVMLTLTAVIFAVLLTSPVRFFVTRGMKRPLAVVLTLVLLLAGIIVTIVLLLPGLLIEFGKLLVNISDATIQLQKALQPDKLVEQFPFLSGLKLSDLTTQISTQLVSSIADITSRVGPFVGGLANVLLNILIIVFLALYFTADPSSHVRGMIKLVPLRYRPRARDIMNELDKTLRRFLQAQIVLMVFSGFSTGIALLVMGVPLAGALGTITGLLSFIPNFGPLMALIPILAVVLINASDKLLLVIIVFYVIQFVQGQIVTPILIGQEMNLSPAVILLSQIIAGIFFGFLGLLLSVPLAAIVVVLVREIYVKDILGDAERGSLEPEASG